MNELSVYQPEVIVEVDQGENVSMTDLLQAAKNQCDLAFGAYRKSVVHVWNMGKLLTEAQAKHRLLKKKLGKDQPNWEVVLEEFGISVASDNRARRLFKDCPVLEQISSLSITQAYEAAGIPKTASKTKPSVASPVTTEEAAATTNSGSSGDNSSVASQESTAAPQSEVNDAEEQEATNNATGSSNDEEDSTEDDFDSADDDLVDDRTIVDMVLDISADMEVLRDRKDTLSAEEINAVLAEVELIAQYALELKIRLEDDLEAAA